VTYPLVRVPAGTLLDVNAFANATGLHPDLVRRLVVLGLVESVPDDDGAPWFPAAQLAAVARIQRLRAGLAINYAAVGLVADLLDRVAELEAALRKRRTGG
jgi:pimeloyl-ACP methyl ester carboxylesterase